VTFLEVRNISLDVLDMSQQALFSKRRKLRILKNVSITLARGETLGIVGESGSGKTSLGRTLLRLLEPSEGQIIFDGKDISHLTMAALVPLRRRMQMIFQDPQSSLNPRHSIARIIEGALRLHELDSSHAALRKVMDRVALSNATLERYPHQLSGGQRQRVGIARAIALQPEFIVADEIVSGLDVSTQAQIITLLKTLCREMGLSLAFISHDLSVIRNMCDRVMIMKQGSVIEYGKTQDIFQSPQNEYTRALIDAIPLPSPNPNWLDN
jgi:ABC-type glutathione transport system ATPase component